MFDFSDHRLGFGLRSSAWGRAPSMIVKRETTQKPKTKDRFH